MDVSLRRWSFYCTNDRWLLVDLLNAASNASKHTATPAQELEVLEQAISGVGDMIDRVLAYVKKVCVKPYGLGPF